MIRSRARTSAVLPSRSVECFLLGLLIALVAGCQKAPGDRPADTGADEKFLNDLRFWREQREQELRSPDGWLTLVGLSWLEEGLNTLGSDPESDVVFPSGFAPFLGEMRVEGGRVTIAAVEGSGIEHEGAEVATLELATDASESPTLLELGSLSFYVIQRGAKLGVRIKDRDSELLLAFSGLDYFPIDPGWRVEAVLEAYDEPRMMKVPNVLGTDSEETSPGIVSFERKGRRYQLSPIGRRDEELFLVFADATNGDETYGGGRFLYAGPPDAEGRLVVDFNRAYNPPCVFTPFATCPLPPPENRLGVAVRAGELVWGAGH